MHDIIYLTISILACDMSRLICSKIVTASLEVSIYLPEFYKIPLEPGLLSLPHFPCLFYIDILTVNYVVPHFGPHLALEWVIPDQSAVQIQYASVYTEVILLLIQCTCSVYCLCSIRYTEAFRVVSKAAAYDHTSHTLHNSTGLPQSMPNANQYRSMSIKSVLLIPMLIKKYQCRSNCLNWSALIFIEWYFGSALISIDRHRALIGGVLNITSIPTVYTAGLMQCTFSMYTPTLLPYTVSLLHFHLEYDSDPHTTSWQP